MPGPEGRETVRQSAVADRQRIHERNGGIVSLAGYVALHGEAVEYDLLTRTGHELKDIGRTLSWDALASFVRQCGNDSALSRELNTEAHIWSTREKTNGILADIFDMLSQINANLVAIGEGKRAKNAPLYPRPGTEERRKSDTQHFGKGALPADELRKWMMEKGVLQNERDD